MVSNSSLHLLVDQPMGLPEIYSERTEQHLCCVLCGDHINADPCIDQRAGSIRGVSGMVEKAVCDRTKWDQFFIRALSHYHLVQRGSKGDGRVYGWKASSRPADHIA